MSAPDSAPDSAPESAPDAAPDSVPEAAPPGVLACALVSRTPEAWARAVASDVPVLLDRLPFAHRVHSGPPPA